MVSHVLDARAREERQRQYLAAHLMADQFPDLQELAVRIRFSDPEGKQKPQPYAQIFATEMRAFFNFQCPLKDCVDGGFDLTSAVQRGLSRKDAARSGTLTCAGHRKRTAGGTDRCNLQLDFDLITVPKTRA